MAREYIDDFKFVSESLTICPYCGSDNITSDGPDYDWSDGAPKEMSEVVECLDCGKFWRDVFAYVYSLDPVEYAQ